MCSAGSYLEIVDPITLKTVGTMARTDDQIISDFAVDDPHKKVFVLSTQRNNSIRLTSYSLLNGGKQDVAIVPGVEFTDLSIAINQKTGQIGISVDTPGRSGNKANVFTCRDVPNLMCARVVQINSVSQLVFFGSHLLIATSSFADDKKDCIVAIDSVSKSASREYCSPSTGVHYAVGVVDAKYVVGFTGIGKRKWFNEENESVTSSFSIWRAENPHVAAVAKDPTDYGAFQNEVRLVASATEPLFIAFQRVSNVLYLYDITDGK